MRLRIRPALFLVLAASACNEDGPPEPAGPEYPCDVAGACVVTGVDLVLDTPKIVNWPRQRTDSATGLPVVLSGSRVSVEIRITNRGDTVSDSARVHVCTNIFFDGCKGRDPHEFFLPRVAPGRSYIDTVSVRVRADPWGNAYPDIASVIVSLIANESRVDYGNNEAQTGIMYGNGRIQGVVNLPPEARVGTSITLGMRLENISPYEPVPADTLFICAVDRMGWPCRSEETVFYSKAIQEIPPGAVTTAVAEFVVPTSALGESPVDIARLGGYFPACLGVWREPPTRAFYGCATPITSTHILPDLEYSCDPLPIAVNTTRAGQTEPDGCRLSIGTNSQVWSFDSAAGASYTIELLETENDDPWLQVVDHNGGRRQETSDPSLTFTTPNAERYYIGVANAGGYRMSFTRE